MKRTAIGPPVGNPPGLRRVSRAGFRHAARGLTRLGLLATSLITLVLARSNVPIGVLIGLVAVTLVTLYWLDRKAGGFGLWAAYIVGFVLFALLRSMADATSIEVKGRYALQAERWLFGGALPTEWLQARLFGGTVGGLEVAAAAVYGSYFLVPHVVALVLWRTDAAAFRRYGLAVLIAAYTGLAVAFAVPTAPPWLADRYAGGPEVTRVLADVFGWNLESGGAGTNPVAAMPSLHIALTALVVAALWRRPVLRELAALYALAMAFVLVSTGEHYVVDEIAGVATAVWAWAVATMVVRARADARRQTAIARALPAADAWETARTG